MPDFISSNNKTMDTYTEHDLHKEYDEYCSICRELKLGIICGEGTLYKDTCELEEKYNCENCKDTGTYVKTEWAGTDTSYEVERVCSCQED